MLAQLLTGLDSWLGCLLPAGCGAIEEDRRHRHRSLLATVASGKCSDGTGQDKTGTCPTSSCHANALGNVELNCVEKDGKIQSSARCPAALIGTAAKCGYKVAACLPGKGEHCFGVVQDSGTPYDGTVACFSDGTSGNWKVGASWKACGELCHAVDATIPAWLAQLLPCACP